MNPGFLFLYWAGISGIANGVYTYMIRLYLSKHGIKINHWNMGLSMLKYLNQYRNITIDENGKLGNLLYDWIVSITLFLVCAAIGMLFIIGSILRWHF